MILPSPVDAEILARIPFALESGFLQEVNRGDVGRNACRLDPVELQRAEREGNDGADGCRHVTPARIRRSHPITETSRLRAAAADIGQGEPADEDVVLLAHDEVRISEVAALILGIAPDAAAEGRPRE